MSFIESNVIDMIEGLGTSFSQQHVPNLQQAVQLTQNTMSKLEGIISQDAASVRQQLQIHLNVYNNAVTELSNLVTYLTQHANELRTTLAVRIQNT